jgi:hypothetical protein
MKSSDSVEQLRAELRQDLDFIDLHHSKNREMTSRIDETSSEDEYDFAALGYTIHNLYNSLESYFLRIAKFFENDLDQREWHKSLVHRMTLDIQGVRPALFEPSFAAQVEELMRFRHLFRNLYKTPLIPQRVLFANDFADKVWQGFRAYHDRFDRFLVQLSRELRASDR